MGCATSKEDKVCRNSAVTRSYSMHVHHPPQRDGDTYHVVALTSTTLGSLKLEPYNLGISDSPVVEKSKVVDKNMGNQDFSMGMIEAKSWSRMMDEKISKVVPRTPIRTPPGEPETIDAFELMRGLEDSKPSTPLYEHFRSFSFGINRNLVCSKQNESNSSSLISDFDPDIITQFRRSLEELPPANPFHLKPVLASNNEASVTDSKISNGYKDEIFGKKKVVLYFTSLRGVRKTYEDCCHVRVILRGLNLKVDERDVSMHSQFKEELKELLGDNFNGGGLPRVFIGKKYIGGAEEMRRMNEDGHLEKVLESCEKVDDGDGGHRSSNAVGRISGGAMCDGCGDVRFVPCETCSGSCKIYYEDDEEENEEAEFGFQRCPDCNENGLIRCPFCCN